MFSLLPPDTKFDFMGMRKASFGLAIALVVASIGIIAAKGLNLGIEFAGGSSAILAFEEGTIDDRQKIATSLEALIAEELGKSDATVSVQDFGSGGEGRIDGRDVNRYLVYTELTSLVDPAKRTEINDAILKAFGESTRIASSEDAGDTLYITFAEEVAIDTRTKALEELFQGLGFESIKVTSDLERQVEVEFLRDVELARQDAERSASEDQAEVASQDVAQDIALDRRVSEMLAGKSDSRFTVDIEALQAAMTKQLEKDFGGSFVMVESSATVSPSVGSDLFNDGLLAMLYSFIGILIYVTLRFDFRYAPGGVIALVHDAVVTMGFIALLDLKFSLQILAAILTVIGYSINDSIIIFDRIREYNKGERGEKLAELINRGINATISRTVVTSLTTQLAILAILFFGGSQIRDFAITIFFGVAIGTFSSSFVASPIIYYLDGYIQRREDEKASEEGGSSTITKKRHMPGRRKAT